MSNNKMFILLTSHVMQVLVGESIAENMKILWEPNQTKWMNLFVFYPNTFYASLFLLWIRIWRWNSSSSSTSWNDEWYGKIYHSENLVGWENESKIYFYNKNQMDAGHWLRNKWWREQRGIYWIHWEHRIFLLWINYA